MSDIKQDIKTAAEFLEEMAETYRQKTKEYGGNWDSVSKIMAALFPGGIKSDVVLKMQWHIFEIIVHKLTRFAYSDLEHRDSVRDIGVYCAIIEEMFEIQDKEKAEKQQ